MTNLYQSQVVCPHCWHKFYADEAHYISRHPHLFGDTVLGDNENRRFAPHEITTDRSGQFLDSLGWPMTERACPQCHLQIPPGLLVKRPFFISVAGCPGSGKTYFLTSAVFHLRRHLAQSFGFSLQDSDSHEVRAFHDYERALFFTADSNGLTRLHKTPEAGTLYNRIRTNNVDVQLPKPFIFTLQPTAAHPSAAKHTDRVNWNLVLYDNAGESFDFLKDKETNVRVTQHLGDSDAVIFTFDPLQVPAVRAKLSNRSTDPQLSTVSKNNRQESFLMEVMNRIRKYRSLGQTQLLPPLLAVCVQKYDVWKSLVPFANGTSGTTPMIDQTSIEFVEKQGIAGLDVDEINRISLLVRAFLSELCPEFVTLAEANFKVVRYFPVSALGTSPVLDHDKELKIRLSDVQPFRVSDPFLWLLWRWRLILRTKRRESSSATLPHAVAQDLGDGRMRVCSPFAQRILILDDEYQECKVLDPQTGQWMWIPKAAPIQPDTRRESPEPLTKAPVEPAPLSLGEPPKPPSQQKRGWFRK